MSCDFDCSDSFCFSYSVVTKVIWEVNKCYFIISQNIKLRYNLEWKLSLMAKYIDTISFCLYSPNEKDNGLPCRKFTLLIDELTFATLLRNIVSS